MKYTPSQIQERYSAWAVLPAKTPEQLELKAHRWNEYCDARDNLPAGHSANRFSLTYVPGKNSNSVGAFNPYRQPGWRKRLGEPGPKNGANAARADLRDQAK